MKAKIKLLWVVFLIVFAGGVAHAEIPMPLPSGMNDSINKSAYSLVMTNGYGDTYRMNMLRDRYNYQAYRGVCSYRGFSLSGCSTTGEVVMLRIKETPSMPEHFSIVSTSLRWGSTMYFLNDVFRPLNNSVMTGYENWYPFDMSCSVAMYVNSGGFGLRNNSPACAVPGLDSSDYMSGGVLKDPFLSSRRELDPVLDLSKPWAQPADRAYSLVMTNGYGDVYRMNMVRDRVNYQAYRGVCSYRGFSLSGCSTTGEVVMLRIKATPTMPEHFSLLSTSKRWGTTMYVLNDVFRPLNDWVMTGYENWYPFDMSCSVAMYVNSGGFGLRGEAVRPEPVRATSQSTPFVTDNGTGTNIIGALLPITGDLEHIGLYYQLALNQAMAAISNTPGMPPFRLIVEDTRTDAGVAYEKLTAMHSNGCHIVIGPESSEECRILKTFANENDVLIVSSASTAPQLAISDDNLMRLVIDDSNQARELAALLADDGITDIAVLARSDIYGEGFMTALIQEHNANGGVVFATNYAPRAVDFIPEVVSNMADQVGGRIAEKGANRVAVVAVLFDEGIAVMSAASEHSMLGSVRWYGTDGMAQNSNLLTNSSASSFAAKTRFVCSIEGGFTNQLYSTVQDNIIAQTGDAVIPHYPMVAYDGLMIIAQALQQSGSTQTMAALKTAIRTAAAGYAGCTGPITFNSSDDRANGSYDFYSVEETAGGYGWIDLNGKTPVVPGNVAASQGDYANMIRIIWNPVSSADEYELWSAVSDQADNAVKIAELDSTEYEVANTSPGIPYYFWVKAVNANGTSAFSAPALGWAGSSAQNDYDGDGRSDFAVFDQSSCLWHVLAADKSTVLAWNMQWGPANAVSVSGDFNGDGKNDFAVYDRNNGTWYVLSSDRATVLAWDVQWGSADGIPLSGDFNGDGKSDFAVYNPNNGSWHVLSSDKTTVLASDVQWGLADAVPVSGDFNGDGKSDFAVYDPNTGSWYVLSSDMTTVLAWDVQWGLADTIPVSGDFNGDGKSDFAVYDPNSGSWYVLSSDKTTVLAWGVQWGLANAVPVSGDFNGDGKSDFAVYDPNTGNWYVLSSDKTTVLAWGVQWGGAGVLPVGL